MVALNIMGIDKSVCLHKVLVKQQLFSLTSIYYAFLINRYKDSPGHPLRCTFDGTLKDLLVCPKPKGIKKIFYQQLSIPVNELENKRPFKVSDNLCVWGGYTYSVFLQCIQL